MAIASKLDEIEVLCIGEREDGREREEEHRPEGTGHFVQCLLSRRWESLVKRGNGGMRSMRGMRGMRGGDR